MTQYGCQKGKSFGGYEPRVWERRGGPVVVATRSVGGPSGNNSNPMTGCRVQQTCKATCGVNRRSREKRQGRKVSDAWQRWAEGGGLFRETASWDRTHGADVGGGVIFGQTQERKSGSHGRADRDTARWQRERDHGRKTAHAGRCLRRRDEGQEGHAPVLQ